MRFEPTWATLTKLRGKQISVRAEVKQWGQVWSSVSLSCGLMRSVFLLYSFSKVLEQNHRIPLDRALTYSLHVLRASRRLGKTFPNFSSPTKTRPEQASRTTVAWTLCKSKCLFSWWTSHFAYSYYRLQPYLWKSYEVNRVSQCQTTGAKQEHTACSFLDHEYVVVWPPQLQHAPT